MSELLRVVNLSSGPLPQILSALRDHPSLSFCKAYIVCATGLGDRERRRRLSKCAPPSVRTWGRGIPNWDEASTVNGVGFDACAWRG